MFYGIYETGEILVVAANVEAFFYGRWLILGKPIFFFNTFFLNPYISIK